MPLITPQPADPLTPGRTPPARRPRGPERSASDTSWGLRVRRSITESDASPDPMETEPRLGTAQGVQRNGSWFKGDRTGDQDQKRRSVKTGIRDPEIGRASCRERV